MTRIAHKPKSSVGREKIAALVAQIVAKFDPNQVILFGSHARRQAEAESDVDLLVIMPYKGSSIDQAITIMRATDYHFPLDLIVRSPAELKARLQQGDFFLKEVIESGTLLYDKRAG